MRMTGKRANLQVEIGGTMTGGNSKQIVNFRAMKYPDEPLWDYERLWVWKISAGGGALRLLTIAWRCWAVNKF